MPPRNTDGSLDRGSSRRTSSQIKKRGTAKAASKRLMSQMKNRRRKKDNVKNNSISNRLMGGIRGIGSDLAMGFGFKDKTDDYYNRTADTTAVRRALERGDKSIEGRSDLQSRLNSQRMLKDMSDRRKKRRRRDREQAAEVATPEVVQPDQQTNQAMLNRMRMQQEQAARAGNMDRARMMFERQNMRSPGPVPRQMQGLGGFRNPYMRRQEQPAQDGGYQRTVMERMPRYPQPMPRNQATSPAFRYAGQNYDRLGGMQRTMPRPMEMMSSGERQQIGRMADRMERPPIGLFQNQNPYVGILQRGISAKGGGRTMPQRPPSRFGGPGKGRSQTMPQGQVNPQLMAALASRFGGRNQAIF